MHYANKAVRYAETYGIVDYKVDRHTMTYEESFPAEGETYLVSVNLNTMKETRTAKSESQHSPLFEGDLFKIFSYLIEEKQITCDYAAFRHYVDAFETPHGVYIDILSNNETKHVEAINQLLNVTNNDLTNYKNAVDWLVQQDERVHYIKAFDVYLRTREVNAITFLPKEESVC